MTVLPLNRLSLLSALLKLLRAVIGVPDTGLCWSIAELVCLGRMSRDGLDPAKQSHNLLCIYILTFRNHEWQNSLHQTIDSRGIRYWILKELLMKGSARQTNHQEDINECYCNAKTPRLLTRYRDNLEQFTIHEGLQDVVRRNSHRCLACLHVGKGRTSIATT